MARILVQLKLRLLLGALRATNAARVSFILSSTVALIVAVATFAGLAALRHNGAAVDLTAVIYTMFAFGWVVLPLIAFGLDTTLDPATLALYPLRTRPLMIGLLAASATGAWPLANLIGELGIIVGLAHGALAVLIAVIAAVLQVLFCITLARLVTTALAGLMRSRRGRDLAALAIIPIFALYEVFAQVAPEGDRQARADRRQLRRGRPLAALAAAGPRRARRPGRLDRARGDGGAPAAPGGRRHRRPRLALGPRAQPCPGDGGHLDAGRDHQRRGALPFGRRGGADRHRRRAVAGLPAPRPHLHGLPGASPSSSWSWWRSARCAATIPRSAYCSARASAGRSSGCCAATCSA